MAKLYLETGLVGLEGTLLATSGYHTNVPGQEIEFGFTGDFDNKGFWAFGLSGFELHRAQRSNADWSDYNPLNSWAVRLHVGGSVMGRMDHKSEHRLVIAFVGSLGRNVFEGDFTREVAETTNQEAQVPVDDEIAEEQANADEAACQNPRSPCTAATDEAGAAEGVDGEGADDGTTTEAPTTGQVSEHATTRTDTDDIDHFSLRLGMEARYISPEADGWAFTAAFAAQFAIDAINGSDYLEMDPDNLFNDVAAGGLLLLTAGVIFDLGGAP